MIRTFTISLFFLLFSAGCSSTPPATSAETLPATARFMAPEITVQLTQSVAAEHYPDQEQFTRLLLDRTINTLKSQSLLAGSTAQTAFSIAINVNYRRQFAGDGTPFPSSSVREPKVDYTIVVSQDGIEKGRVERSAVTTRKGFASNLITGLTMGLGKTAQDEEEDIQILANTLVSELRALQVH